MLARKLIFPVVVFAAPVAWILAASGPGMADDVDDWFEKNARSGLIARTSTRSTPEPSLYPRADLRATIVAGKAGQEPIGYVQIEPNNLRQDKRYVQTDVTHERIWTGAIVPVLGRLCQAKVYRNANGSGSVSFQFIAAKQVPEGISFRKDSFVLPSPRIAQDPSLAVFGTHSKIKGAAAFAGGIRVWEIEVPKEGKPTALIGGVIQGVSSPQMRIKVGDYVQLGDVGHEVVAIVPRDQTKNILGWIELGGDPIPVAKLLEQNKQLVNPRPKEAKP